LPGSIVGAGSVATVIYIVKDDSAIELHGCGGRVAVRTDERVEKPVGKNVLFPDTVKIWVEVEVALTNKNEMAVEQYTMHVIPS
jgi:hypothetical protein